MDYSVNDCRKEGEREGRRKSVIDEPLLSDEGFLQFIPDAGKGESLRVGTQVPRQETASLAACRKESGVSLSLGQRGGLLEKE